MKISWIKLAKKESHWGLYYVLNPPSDLPSSRYWLKQQSLGKRIKSRLTDLLQKPELAHLLKRIGVTVREMAAIVSFNRVTAGYFERTYRKFKKNPPPFLYEKNLALLKKRHLASDLSGLIHRKCPKLPIIANRSITNYLIQHL